RPGQPAARALLQDLLPLEATRPAPPLRGDRAPRLVPAGAGGGPGGGRRGGPAGRAAQPRLVGPPRGRRLPAPPPPAGRGPRAGLDQRLRARPGEPDPRRALARSGVSRPCTPGIRPRFTATRSR